MGFNSAFKGLNVATRVWRRMPRQMFDVSCRLWLQCSRGLSYQPAVVTDPPPCNTCRYRTSLHCWPQQFTNRPFLYLQQWTDHAPV